MDIDPWTSRFLNLKIPVYAQDPNLVSGDGIYKAEEWSLTRKKGSELLGTDGSQYDNDHNYLKFIFRLENMKILSAILLADHFSFGKYKRVFEIGCGHMPQTLVIKNMFPQLKYVATDYDPYVVEKCSKLSIFKDIEFDVFDASSSNLDVIQGFDLLISWGIDATLEDEHLSNLLGSCKKYGVSFLMCSPNIVGLTSLIVHATKKGKISKKLNEHKIRMHGWQRSLKSFRCFSHEAGMNLQIIGNVGRYWCLLFEP